MGNNNGRGKGTELSKLPDPQSLTWLVKQLATLAMARQASVDSETLKFFAVSLSNFHPEDARRALDRLCHTKRKEGETAFPDLATVEEAIYVEHSARVKEQLEEERSNYIRYAETHPQEFVTLSEIHAFVKAKREREGKGMTR